MRVTGSLRTLLRIREGLHERKMVATTEGERQEACRATGFDPRLLPNLRATMPGGGDYHAYKINLWRAMMLAVKADPQHYQCCLDSLGTPQAEEDRLAYEEELRREKAEAN